MPSLVDLWQHWVPALYLYYIYILSSVCMFYIDLFNLPWWFSTSRTVNFPRCVMRPLATHSTWKMALKQATSSRRTWSRPFAREDRSAVIGRWPQDPGLICSWGPVDFGSPIQTIAAGTGFGVVFFCLWMLLAKLFLLETSKVSDVVWLDVS